jgi:hypothetical protein
LQETDGARYDGALVFAGVAFFTRDVHTTRMTKLVQNDARMALEWGLGIQRRN